MREKFPVRLIIIGFIISVVLLICSLRPGNGSYEELILSEFMFENGFLIFAECLIATAVYNILKKKYFNRE